MKKLIFLLLTAVVFAGIVPAWDAAHPPGAISLEAFMSEIGAVSAADNPDAVLAALPVAAEQSSIQAVMALYNYEETAIQPQGGAMPVINTGQFAAEPAAEADYYLRC